MKIKYVVLMILAVGLFGCKNKGRQPAALQEDRKAKQMLQGIWLNEDDQDVAFQVKGDTIFYPDSTSQPVYFQIIKDTFVLHGASDIKYPILRQTPHIFIFRNQEGEEVSLVMSNNPDDAELFSDKHPKALNQNQLIKRDTVVTYGNERYHCYVQVNPTTYKVVKTSYNDDGVAVDNFYYDNIVNLHVFHGSQKLFSSDFRKQAFASKVPKDFLEQAVLSDLVFKSVDDKGIHYVASLVIPDSMSSFEVELTVSFSGRLQMAVV
ncbi:MAG: DUF4738 domain-containing protein [Prevotella sp.]|nr:DUF4738 domain-containing protein [Prevotella sp.]